MDGVGDGLGEDGCLGEVNCMGKVRRWEHASSAWRMGGPLYQKRGEIFLGATHILARCYHSHHLFNILNIIIS